MDMEICFEGIGQVAATFQVSGENVLDNGTVGLGADGGALCGVVLCGVRGGAAAVQIGGTAKVSYSGTTAPAAGWQSLALDGAGGVKTVTTGGLNCLVLAVDKDEKSAVVKL